MNPHYDLQLAVKFFLRSSSNCDCFAAKHQAAAADTNKYNSSTQPVITTICTQPRNQMLFHSPTFSSPLYQTSSSDAPPLFLDTPNRFVAETEASLGLVKRLFVLMAVKSRGGEAGGLSSQRIVPVTWLKYQRTARPQWKTIDNH